MLRAVVVALLLANLGFWAWRSGAFEALGLGPSSERDPARLAQQVQPEAVRVVPAAMAAATLRAASAPLGSATAASAAPRRIRRRGMRETSSHPRSDAGRPPRRWSR